MDVQEFLKSLDNEELIERFKQIITEREAAFTAYLAYERKGLVKSADRAVKTMQNREAEIKVLKVEMLNRMGAKISLNIAESVARSISEVDQTLHISSIWNSTLGDK